MLKIYNTLTRKKETFKPIKKKEVRIYICGPTVNGVPHLGHARQQVTFDVLRKYLLSQGYGIKFVSNITDIDDKIINKANELKRDINEFAKENEELHKEDYKKLNVLPPDVQPHATEFIDEMILLVGKLKEKGYAYVIPDDGVYYDISKFKSYGKLSHQNTKDLIAGAKVGIKESKKNKEDFVLWKFSKPGEPSWDSPWGKGRPGWHIECSAMSQKILGLPFDIHGGGQDLIFPHHEDEIAQSEAAFGKKFVNYWVHNGMVNVDKVKMSKSLGNYKTIRDLFKEYSPETIRYFVISNHYRKPIDFSKESLESAKENVRKINEFVSSAKGKEDHPEMLELITRSDTEFKEAMDDDLNTPEAVAIIFNFIKEANKLGAGEKAANFIEKIDSILGILKKEEEVPEKVKELAKERQEARNNKDWKKSDKLRDKIKELGWEVRDEKEEFILRKI